jgi:hypothetical protein
VVTPLSLMLWMSSANPTTRFELGPVLEPQTLPPSLALQGFSPDCSSADESGIPSARRAVTSPSVATCQPITINVCRNPDGTSS